MPNTNRRPGPVQALPSTLLKRRIVAVLGQSVYEWRMDSVCASLGPELCADRIIDLMDGPRDEESLELMREEAKYDRAAANKLAGIELELEDELG